MSTTTKKQSASRSCDLRSPRRDMQKFFLSRAHDVASRGNEIASRYHEMLSRGNEIIFFSAYPFAGSVVISLKQYKCFFLNSAV